MAITATVAQGDDKDDQGYGATIDTPLSMSADVTFQESCEYDLGDNDQYDWNKVMGFTDTLYFTRSARWGWRWNLANEKVEVAPYVHDESSSAILPPPEQWIQFDLNTQVNLKIEVERANQSYKFTYDDGGTPIIHYVDVTNSLTNAYNGVCVSDLFWFGGNEKAPHEMKIDYDNITYTQSAKKYYITGEATNGVTVTGLYPDGSTPYSQYLAMNQTELTPCLKIGSLSTTDVTISEHSICG
jgi:hypothetical protein